MIYYHTFCGT